MTHARPRGGFTLIELLVVIAIIAIIASLLLPALSSTKSKAKVVTCLGNQKQLALTWTLYQDDFNGRLAQNGVNAGVTPRDIMWVYGGSHANQTAFTNHAALFDARMSLFAPYLRSPQIYKCPEDKSTATFGGRRIPRVRSYSMNSYLAPVGGGFQGDSGWSTFRRGSDIARPSDVFLFMDVYPDTFCMPHFRVLMNGNNWFHGPSNLHRRGGVVSFTDGHVESRRWRNLRYPSNARHNLSAGANSVDLAWVRARTTYDPTGRRVLAGQ